MKPQNTSTALIVGDSSGMGEQTVKRLLNCDVEPITRGR